jgi:uncharacterized protein
MKNTIKLKHRLIESDYSNGYISGYASVFNVEDAYGDVILPNAFAGNDITKVKFLWQHDSKYPIGRIVNLEQTTFGLVIDAQLSLNCQKGAEAFSLINDGVIDGLSIGFEIQDEYCVGKTRFITRLKLWEISVVTFPANEHARIESAFISSIKSAIEWAKSALK